MTESKESFEDDAFSDWLKGYDAIPYLTDPTFEGYGRNVDEEGNVMMIIFPEPGATVASARASWNMRGELVGAWRDVMEEFEAAKEQHPKRNACLYCGNGFDA